MNNIQVSVNLCNIVVMTRPIKIQLDLGVYRMFRNAVEKNLFVYNWAWGKGGIHFIKISALTEGYNPVTQIEMSVPDSNVRQTITTALKSIDLLQSNVLGRANIMRGLEFYGDNSQMIRFALNSLDKADIEKVFSLIHQHQGSQLPVENIRQGLVKIFPQKTGVEIKTLLLVAAAVAAAGAVYRGYQKLSGSGATLFNSAPNMTEFSGHQRPRLLNAKD